MSILPEAVMEILKPVLRAGRTSFEMKGEGREGCRCFRIIDSCSYSISVGKEMSYVKHGTAL